MNKIEFSQNWNEKLCCDFFTSIRLHNTNKYAPGNILEYEVKLRNSIQKGKIQVVHVHVSRLSDIPDFFFFTDMGYSKKLGIEMMETMYKNKQIDIRTAFFDIIVFKHYYDE